MTGTEDRDWIFVAPLFWPGYAYSLVATNIASQIGWVCTEQVVDLGDLCEDGGTILIDGLAGDDTIDLLWSDSDVAGSGHIADSAARDEYLWVLERCLEAQQKVEDVESLIYKADYLYADCETAEVEGGYGDDVIRGTPASGHGTETLMGGPQSDGVFGNGGYDVLFGGSENDWIVCGDGGATCAAYGEGGDDRIYGGAGPNYLYGDAGSDFITGGWEVDRMHGGTGNDYLSGLTGVDRLYGEGGNDLLSGGTGTDVFSGGAGTDTFYCRDDASADPYFDDSDADTDCSEQPAYWGDRGMELTEDGDPYVGWVRRFERTVS